jgi:hypothetical protein
VWVTVAVFALAVPLGYGPLFVLGPAVAGGTYDSAALFGIVTTLLGAGALAGGVLGLRWRPRHPLRTGFFAIAAWPVLLVAFGAGGPVALVLLLAAATGMGFALFDVWWNTAMAERIPPHALSRVSSYDWMGSLVLLPVGYLVAGPVADATSPGLVLALGGAATAAVLAAGLVRARRGCSSGSCIVGSHADTLAGHPPDHVRCCARGCRHDARPRAGLTRRGALAAAAAGTGGGRPARGPGAGGGVHRATTALDPRRAAAFRRLVGVLHGAPDPRFARRPARAATAAFAAWYAGQDSASARTPTPSWTAWPPAPRRPARTSGGPLHRRTPPSSPPRWRSRPSPATRRPTRTSGPPSRRSGSPHEDAAADRRPRAGRRHPSRLLRGPALPRQPRPPRRDADGLGAAVGRLAEPAARRSDRDRGPANPGLFRLHALDEQIAAACAAGLRVVVMPYRFPCGRTGRPSSPRCATRTPRSPTPRPTASPPRRGAATSRGRDPAQYNPSRRALEFRIPDEGVGDGTAWAGFLEFLYARYHLGQEASGRYVHGFELVNEPNFQLWPQRAPSPTDDPFATGPLTVQHTMAQYMAGAQAVAARHGDTTMLFAPSTADSEVLGAP